MNSIGIIDYFESLQKLFSEPNLDNNKLETKIQQTSDCILNSKKISEVPNEKIRNLFDICSQWILKNFSNPLLAQIINLISLILKELGYVPEVKKSDIISILELETYDKIMNESKDKDKSSHQEILKENSIIVNQFLSTFYALIVTISTKPAIILKSKNLLKAISNVFAQICEIDNIAIYYKKKRLIKIFAKILKELKKSTESLENFIQLSRIYMSLFSKVGLKRPIYRDYMLKKGITDLILDSICAIDNLDNETLKSFCLFTFFTTRTVDHKTYFWTKGVVTYLLDFLLKTLNETKNDNDETLLEYLTLALFNLSVDNNDVQMEINDKNFLEIAKTILMKYSKNNFLILNTVSILRRIRDPDFENTMTQELLFTFFALFDYFYLSAKQIYQEEKKDAKFELLILKELVAILGNIVKDENHKKPFLDKNFHIVMLDIKLSFHFYPKLVKNTIGALINLTTSDEIRENLSKVAAFIQSIYLVMDKYQSNQAIIDYELKLIINVLKNDITVKTFIGGEMFLYLLYFSKNFVNNEDIVLNSFKITRNLITKKKGMEEFISKVQDFYKTLHGKETDKGKAMGLYSADLINLLENKIENVNICVEIMLLLSNLTNQDDTFKKLIEKNDNFMKIIQKIINIYSKDESVSKMISQCIAQLPIEEFDAVKYA